MATYLWGPVAVPDLTGPVQVAGALTVTGAATLDGAVTVPTAAAAPSAAYSTASTTPVSTGVGTSLASPGTALAWAVAAIVANNTAGAGASVGLYRSTAGIPAAGSAPATGDVAVWAPGALISGAANQAQAACGFGQDTGLTAGTTYYYYLALAATADTATLAAAGTRIQVQALV